MEYCPLVWSRAAACHLSRLEKAQKRALSLIGRMAIVDSLSLGRTVSGLCFLYKLYSGPHLPSLQSLLPPPAERATNPRTRRQLQEAYPFELQLNLPAKSLDASLQRFCRVVWERCLRAHQQHKMFTSASASNSVEVLGSAVCAREET